VTALLTAAFAVLPPTAVAAMFACEILRQFAYGFTIPLLWAMMADVADFSEWTTGRRATAIVFAAIVFALKAGLGFGGAITGYVLSIYGYVPNAAQAPGALDGIRLTMSLFPAITFAGCAVCLLFYGIDKAREIQMTTELAERRRQYAPEGA
jgi:Na+/melibiose symporter-like transporter